jgi:hypothetical protein
LNLSYTVELREAATGQFLELSEERVNEFLIWNATACRRTPKKMPPISLGGIDLTV